MEFFTKAVYLEEPRQTGMWSSLLPEGLSSEILEMLIRVNQVRPSTEGIVAVLEDAPKHLSPSNRVHRSAIRNSSSTGKGKKQILAHIFRLIAL